jgi:hypothetical protein
MSPWSLVRRLAVAVGENPPSSREITRRVNDRCQ